MARTRSITICISCSASTLTSTSDGSGYGATMMDSTAAPQPGTWTRVFSGNFCQISSVMNGMTG